MTVHEEYTKIIEERYGQYKNGTYEESNDYLWMFDAPEQYLNEGEMLEYVKSHPEATLKEILNYFDEITPDGLPPGIDASDLLVDDD